MIHELVHDLTAWRHWDNFTVHQIVAPFSKYF